MTKPVRREPQRLTVDEFMAADLPAKTELIHGVIGAYSNDAKRALLANWGADAVIALTGPAVWREALDPRDAPLGAVEETLLRRVSCRCLCGAMRYSAVLTSRDVHACHCGMCQKWAGGMSLLVACEPEITFEDSASLGIFQSSEWGERGFCKNCGSPLFWRTRDQRVANIPPAAIDEPVAFRLTTEYCVDRKPDYYHLAEPTKRLTEAEMFALFQDTPGTSDG